MKKIIILVISFIFMFSSISFSQHYNRGQRNSDRRSYQQREQYKNYGQQRKYEHNRDYQYHESRRDYRNHRGYYSHPKGRDYYHMRPGYGYNGHWRSWNEWESYYRMNPHYHRYGHYERINNQLFFLFNDGITAFMFSIGK